MRSTAERRLSILKALCQRHKDNIDNLAFEFGVSRRTIERDIAELSFDHPIYTIQGKGGGIVVDKDYDLGCTYLKPKELELLEKLKGGLPEDEVIILDGIIKQYRRPVHNKEQR